MDVLARTNVPYFPPETDEELVTKQYVDDSIPQFVGDIPVVLRVRVQADNHNWGSTRMDMNYVLLDLDRPCPANCFVQFWRFRRRVREYEKGRMRSGFRAVQHDALNQGQNRNSGGFAVVPVPAGVQRVSARMIPTLFRPARIMGNNKGNTGYGYSRYHREVPELSQELEMPLWMRSRSSTGRRDIKVVLKFGLIRRYREAVTNHWIEERGPMSIETLKIQRWRYAFGALAPTPFWGYHVEVY